MQIADQINPPLPAPSSVCEMCGVSDVPLFGDRHICDACYQICGSCCAEMDDDCG